MSRVSQARSLGKYFLLVDNMLVVLGFFVVFPLISIRFVDQMGWAALMVGIALGLRQFITAGIRYLWRRHRRPLRRETDDRHRYADACRRFSRRWPSPMSRGCCGSRAYSPDSAVHC